MRRKISIERIHFQMFITHINRGITGVRRVIADATQTKIYDLSMIVLIVAYAILVLIQFGLDGQEFYTGKVKEGIYLTI